MELLRIIEPPRTCSYLPSERASLEIRILPDLDPADYANLLARGYRRFGWQVFRPACPDCVQCRSVRVLANRFNPSPSQRRILRKNEAIRTELRPAYVTPEHIELFNTYHGFMHRHRGWPLHRASLESYRMEFLGGSPSARQWLYWKDNQLVGVALMDQVPDAISLVYCFYHPEWRSGSPGSFSILNQSARRQTLGLAICVPGLLD